MTAMTGYRLLSACITHLIGLSVKSNVFLFLYSASENIHHPLIEAEEIMDLTVFASVLCRYYISLSVMHPFCMTAIYIQIKFDRGCMVRKNLLFVV